MKWYVVQVMTGKEKDIKECIIAKGIKALVPSKEMKERKNGKWNYLIRVIFPSYVFVLANEIDAKVYYSIRAIPGIIKFLRDENGPIPIQEDEANYILKLAQNGEPLGISEVYTEGNKIVVSSGPLIGLEGKIIKIDARRFRAKVDITLMGEPRCIELPVNVIKKSEV